MSFNLSNHFSTVWQQQKQQQQLEPIPLRPMIAPLYQCIAVDDLRNGGPFSQYKPGYRERREQLVLTGKIARALDMQSHFLGEAPTGTGKSISYLLAVVRSGKQVIISTATRELQNQLLKDIAFIQQYIEDVPVMVVKGKSNYVCLNRLDEAIRDGIPNTPEYTSLQELSQYIQAHPTFNGEYDHIENSHMPAETRARTCVETDECAGKKCPLYSQCFYYKMREAMKQARIIVVNHKLCLEHIRSGGHILPDFDTIVMDEAHNLESIATDVFTNEIKPNQIRSLLAHKKVKLYTNDESRAAVEHQYIQVWQQLGKYFAEYQQQKKKSQLAKVPLIESIKTGLQLANSIDKLADELEANKPQFEDEENSKDATLYKKLVKRTRNLAGLLQKVFAVDNIKFVYELRHIEEKQKRRQSAADIPAIEVAMLPIQTATTLHELLFNQYQVICLSATLATSNQIETAFQYFKQSVGLTGYSDTIELALPPIFDYEHNALLYIPPLTAMPAPPKRHNTMQEIAGYRRAIAAHMLQLVKASRGGAFLLFCSNEAMSFTLQAIRAEIEQDYPVFVQGEMHTKQLVHDFKASGNGVLFGLKTFWEGIDIAGGALSLVVIDKIPFLPTDDEPLLMARQLQLEAMGHNAFSELQLPQAITRLKQGVGRLIRTTEDYGAMAILDTRIHTTSYGKKIKSALPQARFTQKINDVAQFFNEKKQGA